MHIVLLVECLEILWENKATEKKVDFRIIKIDQKKQQAVGYLSNKINWNFILAIQKLSYLDNFEPYYHISKFKISRILLKILRWEEVDLGLNVRKREYIDISLTHRVTKEAWVAI